MPLPGFGGRRGRMWTPQSSWALGEICYYTFVQNGQQMLMRYQCLVPHTSTNNSPSHSRGAARISGAQFNVATTNQSAVP
ncbi:hypothetical protein EDD85DRAFT_948041 [Armillaria nabsnona]|nr:hypothetical protein EDD85DRAFT_948041 [Armillaria nabsnona]